jgi:hypothetical protein
MVFRQGVKVSLNQKKGGRIMSVVSKNALVSEPDKVACGTAKAA